MSVERQMPRYICHKRVWALEIASVGNYSYTQEPTPNHALVREVCFADQTNAKIPDEVFRRYVPQPGDFYIVYEDGYKSFSPRKQFLDGYVREEARDLLLQRIDQAIGWDSSPVPVIELLEECRAEIARLRSLQARGV